MGATSCCSCSADCCRTVSPCTAAVSWGAAGAWEQDKKPATDSAHIDDLITISRSPAKGDADLCIAAGAPTAWPDQVRSRGAPDDERALFGDRAMGSPRRRESI